MAAADGLLGWWKQEKWEQIVKLYNGNAQCQWQRQHLLFSGEENESQGKDTKQQHSVKISSFVHWIRRGNIELKAERQPLSTIMATPN